MTLLIDSAVLLLLFTFGEYWVHRFWMHRRGSSFFQSHAVEHHGLNQNEDHHMGLNLKQWMIANAALSPIAITFFLTGHHWFPVLQLSISLWWFMSWGIIHRAIHNEPGYELWAWVLLPWFAWAKRHHLRHHKKTTTNFGAVFFWSDYFFRTHYR